MQKAAGIVLILGSVLFIIAAFMPTTIRVITASDALKRVEAIQNERGGWFFVNILFGAGSIIAVAGLALFTVHIQSTGDDTSAGIKLVSCLVPISAAFGTLLWVIISYSRIALSPQEVGNNLTVGGWFFPVYTLLMQIALMVVGVVLIQADYPRWLGWGMLTLGALSLIAYLVFKDMPPFVHYVLLLVMGITLVRLAV